jgi:hypothetical protein
MQLTLPLSSLCLANVADKALETIALSTRAPAITALSLYASEALSDAGLRALRCCVNCRRLILSLLSTDSARRITVGGFRDLVVTLALTSMQFHYCGAFPGALEALQSGPSRLTLSSLTIVEYRRFPDDCWPRQIRLLPGFAQLAEQRLDEPGLTDAVVGQWCQLASGGAWPQLRAVTFNGRWATVLSSLSVPSLRGRLRGRPGLCAVAMFLRSACAWKADSLTTACCAWVKWS